MTTSGKRDSNEGDFKNPYGVCDGFIYVCDYWNTRVQVFWYYFFVAIPS